jgi:hypothetical protein
LTGFFSTGEFSTAALSSVTAVVIAFAPSVIAIIPLMIVGSGASVNSPGNMTIVPAMVVMTGATVAAPGNMTIVPVLFPSAGVAVGFEPKGFNLTFEPLVASGGGLAGFYNDRQVYQFGSTAGFSTGRFPPTFEVFRTNHEWQMQPDYSVVAGSTVKLDIAMKIEPIQNEPVARSRRIRSQMVVS